jgi:hypothetical protein
MLTALYILAILAAIYAIGMYVMLRLIVPFMGFRRYLPPTDLPPQYRELIKKWESESQSQMDFLTRAYDFVNTYWTVKKFQTVTQFHKIFRRDLNRIWNDRGYLHCNTMNYVLFALLANSKFFTANDVRVRHTILNWVQHQYLQVKVDGKWMDVDPAGSFPRGIPLGQRAGLF